MKSVVAVCLVLGVAMMAQAGLVEDFDSYPAGDLGTPWFIKGGDQTVVDDGTGDMYYVSTNSSSYYTRGSAVDLGIDGISDSDSAILSFSVSALTDTCNTSIGLCDLEAGDSYDNDWGSYGPYIGVKNGSILYRTPSGTFLEAVPVVTGQWYDIELVIDNVSDTFDIKVDGILAVEDIAFRKNPSSDLISFKVLTAAVADSGDGQVGIDDIAVTVPEPATMAILGLGAMITLSRKK